MIFVYTVVSHRAEALDEVLTAALLLCFHFLPWGNIVTAMLTGLL